MGIVSKPFTFTNGTTADAVQVNSDFDSLYAEFNGNIDDTNVKSGAAIQGSKLADSPLGIPTAKYNDKSVTGIKIANDPAVDASRAIGTDHIKDKAVTGAKIANDAAVDANRAITTDHIKNDQVSKAKLRLTTHEVPYSQQTPGAVLYVITVNPTIDFPVATYTLLGVFVRDPTVGSGSMIAAVDVGNQGTNWTGKVRVEVSVAGAAVSGTVVYQFLRLV